MAPHSLGGRGKALVAADFCPETQSSDHDERRCEPRFECDREIAILPMSSQKNWGFVNVSLIDCSLHGLGLLLSDPIQSGARFLAMIDLGEVFTLALYEVRHCQELGRGRYKVGAKFIEFAGTRGSHDSEQIMRALRRASESSE